MSMRRWSSLRRATAVAALGAVAARGAAMAMGGCSAPPSGVHVVVAMSDAGYDDEHAFDHLTVTARVGARSAVACAYPAAAVERAVPLEGEPRPTACADRRTQPWTGPPTEEGWALDTLSINVEAAEDEDVEVGVVGGLGGRLGTVRGSGSMRASSGFPELRVELAADEPVFPEPCDARLESSFLGGVSTLDTLCDAPECPDKKVFFRSPAVFCLDVEGTRVSRVRNEPGRTCSDGGAPDSGGLVWASKGPGKVSHCMRVLTKGRFVRCLDGDPRDDGGCALTTDCTPPPTGVGVRAQDAGADGWSFKSIACLPPMGVPITWAVTLQRPDGEVLFGLAQDTKAAEPGSCFLDVYDVATESVDCGAP